MNLLTINSGSSSIKFALYRIDRGEELVWRGSVDGIGFDEGLFRVRDRSGNTVAARKTVPRDHADALRMITGWLDKAGVEGDFDAVGHRIVHGGSTYMAPHLITPELLEALDKLIPFAPDHLPHETGAVRELAGFYPGMRQVACFDTAFHRTMPEVARLYALPEDVRLDGIERYGFHGLSYEYILTELENRAGKETAHGKVIVAHLGNGSSMAAVSGGRCRDTTMGFTPAGGLVMSTRTGDLDPGVLIYLIKERKLDDVALNRLINKESGLLGLSGTTADMKELLTREESDRRAAGAVALYCYQAGKFIGALAAALGGLDTVVFTGGIGENSPVIRERICTNMEFLGIHLDQGLNNANEPVISKNEGVTVRVMKTNEELMIARHTSRLIAE